MKRIARKLSFLALFAAVWLAASLGSFDAYIHSPAHRRAFKEVLPAVPGYALMLLGCYALASIGYALFNFGDCPDAGEEMQRDIADAKRILQSKGFREPPPPGKAA